MSEARLTQEALDKAIESMTRYTKKPFQYPPIHARRYRFYDAESVELGLKREGEPLTWQTIFEWEHECRQYGRFIAYLASMGYRGMSA